MKKRILLLIILFIFIISSSTFFLIINYFDPYSSPTLAVTFLLTSFILGVSGFLTLFLYFIKKIHFRGEVYTYHVKSSFRQAIFISLFIVGSIVFYMFGVNVLLSVLLLAVFFVYLELFIQNLSYGN